jgi:glycosyltransferase involved in cell wall biosynthesis
MIGPEAGLLGVPAAAFRVGGIADWLTEGVNGHLASGTPPTATALADAIVECLRDRARHARLRKGGLEMAQRSTIDRHANRLLELFKLALEPASQTAPSVPRPTDHSVF